MSNTSLNKSKAAKNDEYYTRLEDIEKELVYYRPYLKDKRCTVIVIVRLVCFGLT